MPSGRAGIWILAAAAAAAGVGVGAVGLSRDASKMQASFDTHSKTLTGAIPSHCHPVLHFGPARPPAWLKGATTCHDFLVSVNYTWLADKFLLPD